jgi:hypothetical protein
LAAAGSVPGIACKQVGPELWPYGGLKSELACDTCNLVMSVDQSLHPGFNGLGLDATFDPVNGFQTLDSKGWFVAYEQWWAQNWISTFSYGEADCDLSPSLPDNTYQSATYATVNLIWLPVERMGVGIEFLSGTRENKDGQRGEADRIQMGFQYRF